MHGRIAKTAFLAMTALLAGGAVARGQTSDPPPPASATEDEQRNIFTLQVENDVFNRFNPDRPRLHQRRSHRLAVARHHLAAVLLGGADHGADFLRRGPV